MPNWASGTVTIKGTKENIKKCADRFIYRGDTPEQLEKQKFFARSFVPVTRQAANDNLNVIFTNHDPSTVGEFILEVEFAWSAHSCLIDGYPQKLTDECTTLSDACKSDQVKVDIWTTECGLCFQEYITCDENGRFSSECMEIEGETDYE